MDLKLPVFEVGASCSLAPRPAADFFLGHISKIPKISVEKHVAEKMYYFFFLKFYFKVLTTTKRTRDVIEKIYRGPGNFRENDTLFLGISGFFWVYLGLSGFFWVFLGFFGIFHFSGGAFYRGGKQVCFWTALNEIYSMAIFFLMKKLKHEIFGTFFNYNVNH